MKIFETKDIREIDNYTIEHEPIASVDLMERAAEGCALWILDKVAEDTTLYIFVGPGNNGGDGWAIARLLAQRGLRNVKLFQLLLNKAISADAEVNRQRLLNQGIVPVHDICTNSDFPVIDNQVLVVDALFGSGLTHPPEGLSLDLVKHINSSGCKVIAIDIPSGLLGEDNIDNPREGIIRARHTLTFQFPKRSFFYAENESYTGKWHVIPIGLHPDIINRKQTDYHFTELYDIQGKIKERGIFSHKGTYGHALLIAGSYGMAGAAILSAKACLRSGVGLLTTHIPGTIYQILQTTIPESVVSIDNDERHFSTCPALEKYSAVGIGPGIGVHAETVAALESVISTCDKPMILDADALNIIAENRFLIEHLKVNTIITPHPGEFDRLAGKSENAYQRNQRQIEFSKEHKLIIVLKGAFSSVTLPDGKCFFNSTGNPGMATAGSGDVLTGIVLSLLAQGYSPAIAAIVAVFIHGMAGDIAVAQTGEEALIASDMINNLMNVFLQLHNHEKSL
jgi:ADP-dependent NAD(P)H-hydrate dehydratase / NAD(P)H-hydrate epimerase